MSLIRAKKDLRILAQLQKKGKKAMRVLWTPNRDTHYQLIKLGESTTPIPVRVLAIPVETGETEYLVTNLLNAKAFPYSDFKDLYHRR